MNCNTPQFTVVTYFTPIFEIFVAGLNEDCQRLSYPIHCEALSQEFDNLIQAFDFKISYIRDMVRRYGRVLWLDVECRIVRPIPQEWTSPLISTYATGKSNGFSSGLIMLDATQLEFIDLWVKYAHKYPEYPDDFVLDFLSNSVSFDFGTVPLEFYDRETQCAVVRGQWKNEHTVIQHPTINRWPEPAKYRRAFNGKDQRRRSVVDAVSRQRKGIFYRNFGGDFDRIDEVMRARTETEYHDTDWVFDGLHQLYAPQQYWPKFVDDFTAKPRSFEQSRENFNKIPKGLTFRAAAMRKMQLDSNDLERYGQMRSSGFLSFAGWIRRFFLRHS